MLEKVLLDCGAVPDTQFTWVHYQPRMQMLFFEEGHHPDRANEDGQENFNMEEDPTTNEVKSENIINTYEMLKNRW